MNHGLCLLHLLLITEWARTVSLAESTLPSSRLITSNLTTREGEKARKVTQLAGPEWETEIRGQVTSRIPGA